MLKASLLQILNRSISLDVVSRLYLKGACNLLQNYLLNQLVANNRHFGNVINEGETTCAALGGCFSRES